MTVFHARRDARGFTLIELLVVVAIFALLIGILIPTLRAARIAAWNAQCLSQLRQQGIASAGFLTDYEYYPLVIPYRPGNTTFKRQMLGGMSDHPDLYDSNYFEQWIPETERPLNPYLYDDVAPMPFSYDDPYETNPALRAERPVFEDPADKLFLDIIPEGIVAFSEENDTTIYESFGSSYAMNTWYWYARGLDQTQLTNASAPLQAAQRSGQPLSAETYLKYGREFLEGKYKSAAAEMQGWNQSQFVLQMDYLFNYSFFGDTQLLPNPHSLGSDFRHNLMFADGHAKSIELKQEYLEALDYDSPSGEWVVPAGPGWSMTDYRYDTDAIDEFLQSGGN